MVFTAISGEELNLTPQAQENEANISEGEEENLIDFQRKVRLAIQEGIYFDIIHEPNQTLPMSSSPKTSTQTTTKSCVSNADNANQFTYIIMIKMNKLDTATSEWHIN